jgi:hypothetical protein
MAVTRVLCVKELYQDHSQFTIEDESEWTDDAPDTRDYDARFLVAAKMSEIQALTFITVENDDPFNDLEWDILSSGIGAYRFFYIDIPVWLAGTLYYAHVEEVAGTITSYANIVYADGVYYKAIVDNTDIEPGVTTDWEDSWEIFDTDLLYAEILNDRLTIHIHDDLITSEYDECILDHLDEMTDKELCGACCDTAEFMKLMKMQFMLDAAESCNWQEKAPRADLVINEASKKFCC